MDLTSTQQSRNIQNHSSNISTPFSLVQGVYYSEKNNHHEDLDEMTVKVASMDATGTT